jgi:myosin I
MTTVKFVKDPNVPRDDMYKSSTVHVPEGLPPNSGSRPTPRHRATPAAAASYPRTRAAPAARPAQIQQASGVVRQQPVQVQSTAAQLSRAQPPPPPPPPPMQPPAPAEPIEPIYRALYDFSGQTASEMSFSKGEVLDITKKETNGMSASCANLISGWWLAKKDGKEGWVPQNYLKEEIPAPTPRPVAPPPAPALRPQPSPAVRVSPANPKPKPAVVAVPSAPKPPVANGNISIRSSLTPGGIPSAPKPPVADASAGRKLPPPAPSTRPTRTTKAKPPAPPAPPAAKQASTGSRPNLAANLADMVIQTCFTANQ